MTLRVNIQVLVAALAAVALGATLARVAPPLLLIFAAAGTVATLVLATRWSVEKVGYALLAAALITITWNGVTVVGGGSPTTSSVAALAPVDILLAPAVFLLVLQAVGSSTLIRLPAWMMFAGGLMLATQILAALFPPHFAVLPAGHEGLEDHLINLLKFETALVVVPLTLMLAGKTSNRITRLADLWALSAILSATVAGIDHVGLANLTDSFTAIPHAPGREAGLTFQANHLAIASVMALPVVLTWISRGRAWVSCGVVGAGLLLTGVVASGSRTGAVAAAIAFTLTVAALPSLRRAASRGALVVAMAVIVLLPTIVGIVGEAATQLRLTPNAATSTALSDSERAQASSRAKQEFNARPLQGVGFAVVYRAHNIYLQLLAAGGVLALAAFAVYIAGTARLARAALRTTERPLAVALSAAVAAWLAAGAVSNQLIDRYPYVPVGLLLAIALLPQGIRTTQKEATAM